MSPTYPLDPSKEMSEAQWQGYQDLSFERSLRARGYRTVEGPTDPGRAIKCPSDTMLEFYERMYGKDLVRAGLAVQQRLRGDLWRTREGEEMTVDQMGLSHVQNLVRWIERRAKAIHLGARIEMMCMVVDHDGGMHAYDLLEHEERELEEMDPIDYVRGTKFYGLLMARIDAAGIIT